MTGSNGVEVRLTKSEAEIDAAKALRIRVFCGEQGVSPAAEIDEVDAAAMHFVALQRGDVIGTCRLHYPRGKGKIERMVVDPALRRSGVGSLLVSAAEREAFRAGVEETVLHAQRRSEAFYAACGYDAEGETFFEEEIPHVLMRKRLDSGDRAGVDAAT